MMPSQISVKLLRRFDVDLCTEGMPEAFMLVGWAREQEVIDVDH